MISKRGFGKADSVASKKRDFPAIGIAKSKPDILLLYEPVALGDFRNSSNLNKKIIKTLEDDLFSAERKDIAYYRVGSFKALEKIGYKHVTISYPDRVFSIFVHNRIYDSFLLEISKKGFTNLGKHTITYSINTYLTKHFLPISPETTNSF